jgi:carbamoyltransferase
MYTLGINAAYHDSAACLVKDGIVIAAAEEERFTRKKHGKRPIPFSTYELPYYAINYCLEEAGIHLKDVDHIAYSYNPYLSCWGNIPGRSRLPCRLSPVLTRPHPNGKQPGIRCFCHPSSTHPASW